MKVWIQSNKNEPLFDFAEDAYMGAKESHMEVKRFDWEVMDHILPTDMVVGSVEATRAHFVQNGIQVPDPIISRSEELYGPQMTIQDWIDLEEEHFPLFIKPADQTKAFTGFGAYDKATAEFFMEGYEGRVICKELVEYFSEWRAYVQDEKILKICHYLGDPLQFPDPAIIKLALEEKRPEKCYSIDFGITKEKTYVIEMNDAWAIGNYGLAPYDYFQFLKKRWVQIIYNVR